MRLSVLLTLLALAVVPRPAGAAERQVKIAVLDLQARGVDPALASSAGTLIASELNGLGVFKVISREDIRNMLSFEKDRESVGCAADQECLAEIGGALGVEYIVAGSLARIGDATLLSLQLNDVRKATVENRVSETVTGKGDALIAAVRRNAQKLVSPVLRGREGYLVLTSREEGATVKIDGQIRGSTPLPGRLALSWGPHRLEVEKTGFIQYSEDLEIPDRQAVTRNVALVPSEEFIRQYASTAGKMRTGAWIATGAAVAGAGLAVIFNQLSSSTEDSFQQAKAQYLQTGDAAQYDQLKSLQSKGDGQVLVARVGLATSVLAAGLATWFWVAGDDPHRYDSFREVHEAANTAAGARLSLAAVPLAGGGAVGMGGRF